MRMVELCHIAATEADRTGYYPLHYACNDIEYKEVAVRLLAIFPDAATRQMKHGKVFALHCACYGQSLEVIQKLVDINPIALNEINYSGWYPIHQSFIKR
jgi:ankyrin repeat protein